MDKDDRSPRAQPEDRLDEDWFDRKERQFLGWFQRLGWIQKLLASIAALIITIGGVSTAITATLALLERVLPDPPSTSVPYLGIRARDVRPMEGDFYLKPLGNYNSAQGLLGDVRSELTTDGVRVIEVYPDGPAASAGVKPQDVITDVNGSPVHSVQHFELIMKEMQPGESLWLSIVRDSHRMPIRGITLESAEGATMPE